MNTNVFWKTEEVEILKNNAHLRCKELQKLLPNKTIRQIGNRKNYSGLQLKNFTNHPLIEKRSSFFWTEKEINILRLCRNNHAKNFIPNRSVESIQNYRTKNRIPLVDIETSNNNYRILKESKDHKNRLVTPVIKESTKNLELIINGTTVTIEGTLTSHVYISKKGIKIDF